MGEASMKRALIVDDHAVVRNGLKKILEEQPGEIEFGEAGTAEEAIEQVREQAWDIVILDISLGGGRNGLDTLKELKQIQPRLQVLILTMHSEEQYARRSFRSGAAGYITKDSPRAELIRAVSKVMEGGKYVSPVLAEKLVAYIEKDINGPPHDNLSEREFKVMLMFASGKTVGEISELLWLCDQTISTSKARNGVEMC